jgi:hypothetical protein
MHGFSCMSIIHLLEKRCVIFCSILTRGAAVKHLTAPAAHAAAAKNRNNRTCRSHADKPHLKQRGSDTLRHLPQTPAMEGEQHLADLYPAIIGPPARNPILARHRQHFTQAKSGPEAVHQAVDAQTAHRRSDLWHSLAARLVRDVDVIVVGNIPVASLAKASMA